VKPKILVLDAGFGELELASSTWADCTDGIEVGFPYVPDPGDQGLGWLPPQHTPALGVPGFARELPQGRRL